MTEHPTETVTITLTATLTGTKRQRLEQAAHLFGGVEDLAENLKEKNTELTYEEVLTPAPVKQQRKPRADSGTPRGPRKTAEAA